MTDDISSKFSVGERHNRNRTSQPSGHYLSQRKVGIKFDISKHQQLNIHV